MVDSLTPDQRSWNMSRIRGKNTKPEMIVRSVLHRLGYRFRLHRRDLPGKPDIVLSRHRLIIFVNGCYWHRHAGCRLAYTPKTRTDFWQAKFKDNVARDRRNQKALTAAGWRVIVIWECQTRDTEKLAGRLVSALKGTDHSHGA